MVEKRKLQKRKYVKKETFIYSGAPETNMDDEILIKPTIEAFKKMVGKYGSIIRDVETKSRYIEEHVGGYADIFEGEFESTRSSMIVGIKMTEEEEYDEDEDDYNCYTYYEVKRLR